MHIGPDSLIVAARVDLRDDVGAGRAENLADEIDARLSEKLPPGAARVHRSDPGSVFSATTAGTPTSLAGVSQLSSSRPEPSMPASE
jgi:hypothetical protein